MARAFSIGFEEAAISTVEFPFNTVAATGLTLDTVTFRSGSRSIKCTYGAGQGVLGGKLSASHIQYLRAYINIGVNPSANHSIIMFIDQTDGIALCYVDINTDGTLALKYSDNSAGQTQQGSNSVPLGTGSWHMVELKCDDTAGLSSMIIEARLDGVVFATGTVVSNLTGNGGLPSGFYAVGWAIFGETLTSGNHYMDDIAQNDGAGTDQNSYPGQEKLVYLRPNAAGDANTFGTQTGGTVGAANNFTRVNEVTPNDATSFNGSSTLNQEDTFNMDNSSISPLDTVNVVHVLFRIRNSTADTTAAIVSEVKKTSGGTIATSSNSVPNTTTFATILSQTLYKDPDGNPWTQLTLDSMIGGYKLKVGPAIAGRRIDVTAIWIVVGYTPAIIAKSVNVLQAINRGATY